MTAYTGEPILRVNTSTTGDQVTPSLAVLPNGERVEAWTSTGSTMAQLFDASGNRIGGELVLAQGYTLGDVTALPDNSFVASLTRSWFDAQGAHSAVYAARFDASGAVLSAPQQLVSGNNDLWVSGGPVFAVPGGGYAVTVVSTSRPTPVSEVNDSLVIFDAANSQLRTVPGGDSPLPSEMLTEMRNGDFVVAEFPYTGPAPSRMSWKVVDPTGQTVSSAQYQGTYQQSDYGLPSTVALADGSALVVWFKSDYAVRTSGTWEAQRIDANGQPTGSVFDWQFPGTLPHLTALPYGGLLATWETHPNATGPAELYGQTFDGSLQATSAVMDLGTLTSHGTYDADYSVAATSDRGFLIEYQATADGEDIFQRKFDAVPDGSSGTLNVAGGVTPVPAGNYTIVGTAGIDTISVSGAHTQYHVTPSSLAGPEGVDALAGIERIRFGDGTAIALDINGDAGEAYRLYLAAFDRAPDPAGLGFHINDLDRGVPLWGVAQHFIDSPEFQTTYGGLDNAQFITLLYRHVLHRDPEPAGLQYHLDEFAHGESRADMLTHFSESPENQANVIGQIANGMLYVPIA